MASITKMNAKDYSQLDGKRFIKDGSSYSIDIATAEKLERLRFVRRVFGLWAVQLLGIVVAARIHCVIDMSVHNGWTEIGSTVLAILTLIALILKKQASPINRYLLAIYMVIQAYIVGEVVGSYRGTVVLQGVLLTFAVVLAISLFTFYNKMEFSFTTYGLFAVLMGLSISGVFQIFGQYYHEILFSNIEAVAFSLFLIFDTQTIMATLYPADYVQATIQIQIQNSKVFLLIILLLLL